jgi:hypothetical protein
MKNKKPYQVLKGMIKLDMCNFLTQYFFLKRKLKITYDQTQFISPFNKEYGDFKDPQCMGAWSIYSDTAAELVMQNLKPVMEKATGKKLMETYSYLRIYEKGHELKRHKDRASCEISATINLGGAEWPIYIAKSSKHGIINDKEKKYYPSNNKGEKIILNPGDMLIYKGAEFEHWREPLQGSACVQLFIHFVEDKKENVEYFYDSRPFIGLADVFKKPGIKR